jgi:PAS domain S-box-containing protein
MIALAATLSFFSLRQQQTALRAEGAHYVADTLREVEQDLLGQVEILKALASSPALHGPDADLETFRAQAAQLRQELKHWDVIILADLEGRQVVNTRLPAGSPLPRVVDPDTFRRVVETGEPLIGNAAGPGPAATDGMPRVSIRVPVVRDGAMRYVLTGVVSPERLSRLHHGLEPTWRAFLLDGAGIIVAASRREIIGQRPSEQTLAARAARRGGIYDGVTLDGIPTIAAFQASERIGWSAHVVIPKDAYNAPLQRSFWYVVACIAAALALTLILIEYLRREARDQERAAAQLKEAESRYRLLAENATDMIIRTGLDGVRLYVSSACRDILGYGPEEYVGSRLVDIAHPDDVAAVRAGLEALAAGRIEQETVTYRVAHKDGHWVWLEARRRLVRDAGGKPLEIVSVVRDISERVRLEEQFRQAQKMEAVGQLTGGIAHDFNNLLTIILGNAEILTDSPDAPPALRAPAQQILEAAERGSELNQKLLAFGRRQSLKPERLKMGRVVEGMVPLLNRTLGEHIELRTEPGEETLWALTDRTLLESAILNLASTPGTPCRRAAP